MNKTNWVWLALFLLANAVAVAIPYCSDYFREYRSVDQQSPVSEPPKSEVKVSINPDGSKAYEVTLYEVIRFSATVTYSYFSPSRFLTWLSLVIILNLILLIVRFRNAAADKLREILRFRVTPKEISFNSLDFS